MTGFQSFRAYRAKTYNAKIDNKLQPDSYGTISRKGNCSYLGCEKLVETNRDTAGGAFTIGYCREHAVAATYRFGSPR